MYGPESETPSLDDAGNPVDSRSERSSLPVEDETTGADADNGSEGPLKTGDYQLPCGAKLHFYDSVRNDVTGR